MKRLLIILALSTHTVWAARVASLPGGLMFPMYSISALTNAAALTTDWVTEVDALYSPPNNEQEPHSYLVGLGIGKRKFGLNVGYTGSTHSGTAFHNVFGGASVRWKRFSFGLAARKLDIMGSKPIAYDLSTVLSINSYVRLGAVVYDVGQSRQIALGLGFGRPQRFTLDFDVLAPMTFDEHSLSTEYSANVAAVLTMGRLNVSGGVRYSKIPYSNIDSNDTSVSTGLAYRLFGKINAVGLYTSAPQTFSVGLAWCNGPSAEQYIKAFREANKGSIGKAKNY